MKKIISIILGIAMLSLPLTTYSKAEEVENKRVKIGIVTGTKSSDEISYEAAEKMVDLYELKNTKNEIEHFALSEKPSAAKKVLDKIIADDDIEAVVFSGNNKNMLNYIKEIKSKRDNMLFFGANLSLTVEEMSKNLDLSFIPVDISDGKDTVMLAKDMGAEAFVVYYSDKDLKENEKLIKKIEDMKKECADQDVEFTKVKVADINSKEDEYKVKKFISEDIEKQVYKYGKNINLYGTNNIMDDVIIKRAIKSRLIIAESSDGYFEDELSELYRIIMRTGERGNFRGNAAFMVGKNAKYNMERRIGGLLMPNDYFAIYSATDTALAALEQDVKGNDLCKPDFIEKSISEKDAINGEFKKAKSGINNVKIVSVDQVIY